MSNGIGCAGRWLYGLCLFDLSLLPTCFALQVKVYFRRVCLESWYVLILSQFVLGKIRDDHLRMNKIFTVILTKKVLCMPAACH